MPATLSERRSRKRSNHSTSPELRIAFIDPNGHRQAVTAAVLDLGHEGMGVELRAPLAPGLPVTLRPGAELENSGLSVGRARVLWCKPGGNGRYRAGLIFDPRPADQASMGSDDPHTRGMGMSPASIEEDLYEVLQVNPKADYDTIHRVYRILAQRYHPDNQDTGDEAIFKKITRAFQTLSNPSERTAYDVARSAALNDRMRLFDTAASSQGSEGEKRKRHGLLSALYRRRLVSPFDPSLTIFELEDLMAVPREHLEFTLWYLKERGLVVRTDNNRFHITVNGVDEAERLEVEVPKSRRMLPAASD